jgi:hypothetical protein
MGLLDRAGNRSAERLDEGAAPRRGFLDRALEAKAQDAIETLFDERIARIPADGNASLSALSIIKAFFPCEAVFFARLAENRTFAVYASHALESFASKAAPEDAELSVRIPAGQETVRTYSASDLGLCDPAGDAKAVVFTLSDKPAAGDSVLVLLQRSIDEKTNSAIRRVLTKNGSKFQPRSARPVKEPTESEIRAAVGAALEACGGSGELIVFNFSSIAPERLRSAGLSSIRECVGGHGAAAALQGSRVLVALKPGSDRDLFAHHIMKAVRKSFPVGVDISVSGTSAAGSVQDALDFIDSFS